MAIAGGSMLVMLILITCLSILGRSLSTVLHSDFMTSSMPELARLLIDTGLGPINGDYELLQAGMAFLIFAFLPICQVSSSHAAVDVFTAMMPPSFGRFMVWLCELVFAFVLIIIAWQLTNGLMDKYRSGETTYLLEFPIWWSYALSLIAACVAAIVALVMVYIRSRIIFFDDHHLSTQLNNIEGD